MNQSEAGEAIATGNPESFAAAHRELLTDKAIQFDLPTHVPPELPKLPQWLLDLLNAIAPILKIMFWAGLAIVALLILFAIFRRISDGDWSWARRRKAVEGVPEPWRPAEAPARALLRDADDLAAAGSYTEAAHLLLYRSIEDIDRRRPDLVQPALTSRDIAGSGAIPAAPKNAFSTIVMLVERSLFGRVPLEEQDWRRCRAAYEDFAFASGWRE